MPRIETGEDLDVSLTKDEIEILKEFLTHEEKLGDVLSDYDEPDVRALFEKLGITFPQRS